MKRNARSSIYGDRRLAIPTTEEAMYPFHISTTQPQLQDSTAYNAVCLPDNHSIMFGDFYNTESDPTYQVSSFNYPAPCDPSLLTPVSMTSSPSLPSKISTSIGREVEIKLSPASVTPNYNLFNAADDGQYSPKSPMKHKYAYSVLHDGSLGPESPTYCTSPPVPYFSSYGVSANSQGTRMSHSPPTLYLSPDMQPARGPNCNNKGNYQQSLMSNSLQQNGQAPVRIAPHPHSLSLRAATNSMSGLYQQNLLPSSRSPPRLQSTRQTAFPQGDVRITSQNRKGLKGNKDSLKEYQILLSNPELHDVLKADDRLMLDRRYRDGLRPWMELEKEWSKKAGKKVSAASLQMRKRRLFERAWYKAFELKRERQDKSKWEAIMTDLQKYAPRRTPKEATDPLDLKVESFDQESWSGGESVGHSLHESDPGDLFPPISSAIMDDVHSSIGNTAARAYNNFQSQQFRLRLQQANPQYNVAYGQRGPDSWFHRRSA